MAKSKSSRFFGLPSKCKCGLSRAVLPHGQLGNWFTGVQVDLGGTCFWFPFLWVIWFEIWNEVLTWRFVWDWAWILLVGRNLGALYFQMRRWSGVGLWTEQTGQFVPDRTETRLTFINQGLPAFQGELFSTGNLWDSSRTLLTSHVSTPVSILLSPRKAFPWWLKDQSSRELSWVGNEKLFMLLSHGLWHLFLLADQPDVCCFPSRCLWEPWLQEPLLCYHPWWGERLRAKRGASPVLVHWVISWCSHVQHKGLSIQDVKPCGHQKKSNKITENRLKLFNAPVFIKYQNTIFVRVFSPSFFFLSLVWNGIFLMNWCFCGLLTNLMFTRWSIGHWSLT